MKTFACRSCRHVFRVGFENSRAQQMPCPRCVAPSYPARDEDWLGYCRSCETNGHDDLELVEDKFGFHVPSCKACRGDADA